MSLYAYGAQDQTQVSNKQGRYFTTELHSKF